MYNEGKIHRARMAASVASTAVSLAAGTNVRVDRILHCVES
jgi:hypothetical protein